MSTFQTNFKPLWLGGGGDGNRLVEVTVNSMEENSEDFCLIYVQEFGLWKQSLIAAITPLPPPPINGGDE
jgi:hypothetical protein